MNLPDMTEKVKVKVETFHRVGRGYGCRICFMYADRGPEIFEKDGLPTELVALQWGKDMVKATVESIPGATAREEPCRV